MDCEYETDPSKKKRNVNDILGQDAAEVVREVATADLLDPKTTKVRRLLREALNKRLREALNKRFHDRYHPLKSLANWRKVDGASAGADDRVTESNVELSASKYDDIFELQSLMLPSMRNMDFIKTMINNVDFNDGDFARFRVPEHYKDIGLLRRAVLWRKIRSLATAAARILITCFDC
jgi:hypothetical protein